ncbi:hypothetical protein QFC19_002614 [Naganishia cerealis]|uniref:Uncharacterized protein n=1 Tax=Naganishia cerealis TaxID=610337 RepID=A0ACC2WBB0_9TREE|nr:hypothetical protein QFC19_002614 [Naganishia cerealis]
MRPSTTQPGTQRKRLSFSHPSRNGLFPAVAGAPSTTPIALPPGHFLALPPTHAAAPASTTTAHHHDVDVQTSAQTVTPNLAAGNLAPNTSTTASADFEVDVRTGFLPFDAAVDRLPAEYEVWEEALWAARGEGVVGQNLRLGVDGLQEQVWRKGIEELIPSRRVDACALHPFATQLVAQSPSSSPRLVVPVTLLRTHSSRVTNSPNDTSLDPGVDIRSLARDTVLYNSHPVNPHSPPSFERNPYVKSLVTFTNTSDEAHFYLTSTRCELAGVNALSIMRASLDEAFMADSLSLTRLTGYLNDLAAMIDHIGDIILDVRNGCDPAVFYHLIRPWFKGGDSDGPNSAGWAFLGVQEETTFDLSSAAEHATTPSSPSADTQSLKGRKFSGPSAGQSSLIHALDVFLTVDHTPKEQGATAEETFMTRMLMYMPAPHRAFLQHLSTVPHPIRSLVTANREKRPALVAAYDHALEALKRLREKHMRIATIYVIQQARRPPTAALVKMGAVPTTTTSAGQEHVKLHATSLSEIIRDEEEQDGLDDQVRGTGGTALIKFLKMCRDNTACAKLSGVRLPRPSASYPPPSPTTAATMSSLLPNQHRSTSDRLLNNYLSSQKQLSTALLTLLSHSHSSSSSLLAYVTSSPGVLFPVRRAVQYAAFEGPSSGAAYNDSDGNSGKWNEYIQSLENFRVDLKQVHSLEEELSQVKRDREILVSRLIKATRSKPSKKDILRGTTKSQSGASEAGGSVLSFRSDESEKTSGGTSKRQTKLAEAQAEVLGCEEHLRSLEVRLEDERSKVMKHGLMERFKAMEDVGRMWQRQARLGIAELQRADGLDGPLLPPNAYELDSNGSIAPSQSASQIGYGSDGEQERSHGRANNRNRQRVPPITGSVTGSIAEEDENQTSGSEDEGNLVVHENTRGGAGISSGRVPAPAKSNNTLSNANGTGSKRFSAGTGHGVPSITDFRNVQRRNSGDGGGGSSDGSSAAGGRGGRRTQSEVALGYNPPRNHRKRQSIRRAFSGGAASDDGSSIRSLRGNGKKKGGFFRSLAKLFKTKPAGGEVGSIRGGGSRRGGGADSPPLTTRSTSGWTTRTDTNLRARSAGISARGAEDSSDDEDTMGRGAMMAVTNNRNNTWSVDKVGVAPGAAAKPAAKTIKKSRSDLGAGGKSRSNSQSTITPVSGATGKVVSKPPGVSAPGIVRSNTMTSVGTADDKSSKRLRHGSITRTRAGGSNLGGPSIASVLDNKSAPAGPKLMEVPKAPKSQLVGVPPPLSTSASAPLGFAGGNENKRSSTISQSAKSTASSNATAMPRSATTNLDTLGLGAPVGSGNSHSRETSGETADSLPAHGQTPLPPSKTLSPPAKSAMRTSSPVPSMQQLPLPPPAFMVTAPGPVVLDRPVVAEKKPEAVATTTATKNETSPEVGQRSLVTESSAIERPLTPTGMTTDGESIYESAVESEDEYDGGRTPATTPMTTAPVTSRVPPSETGSDESDDTAIMSRYKVVENTEGLAAKHKESKLPVEDFHHDEEPSSAATKTDTLRVPGQTGTTKDNDDFVAHAPVSVTESTLERRKSVRMNVPDSPSSLDTPPRNAAATNGNGWSSSRVGRVADSSEEDESAAYVKAKKGLQRYANLSPSSPGKTPKKKKSTTKSPSSKVKA